MPPPSVWLTMTLRFRAPQLLLDAKRKGYAGVALYSRHEPDKAIHGFGVREFDAGGPLPGAAAR